MLNINKKGKDDEKNKSDDIQSKVDDKFRSKILYYNLHFVIKQRNNCL